ncbi:COG1470 family protein [Streptomyces sp. NPDC002835]
MRAAVALVLALAAPPPTAGWEPGREYVYLEGGPGAVLEDRFSVVNPGPRRLTVDLRASRAPTPWIALAAGRVTIPARTRAEVPFTVTVPADTPPGEQTATITASAGGRSEPIRIHLRVSGPKVPALTVEDVSYSGGSVHYTLVNRGNTPLSPRVALHSDGFLTGPAARPPREPGPLPPASRVSLSERWDAPALDAVDLRVRATAAGGVRAESAISRTFVPWPVLLPVLGLLLLPVPLWLRRRAKRAGG